jgi:hypothetical protein
MINKLKKFELINTFTILQKKVLQLFNKNKSIWLKKKKRKNLERNANPNPKLFNKD